MILNSTEVVEILDQKTLYILFNMPYHLEPNHIYIEDTDVQDGRDAAF